MSNERRITKEEFLEALRKDSPKIAMATTEIIDRFEELAKGKFSFRGSKYRVARPTWWAFYSEEARQLIGFRSDGKIEINLQRFEKIAPFSSPQALSELRSRFEGVFGCPFDNEVINSFDILHLNNDAKLNKLVEIYSWAGEEIESAQ